jgi:hypothetical protein
VETNNLMRGLERHLIRSDVALDIVVAKGRERGKEKKEKTFPILHRLRTSTLIKKVKFYPKRA